MNFKCVACRDSYDSLNHLKRHRQAPYYNHYKQSISLSQLAIQLPILSWASCNNQIIIFPFPSISPGWEPYHVLLFIIGVDIAGLTDWFWTIYTYGLSQTITIYTQGLSQTITIYTQGLSLTIRIYAQGLSQEIIIYTQGLSQTIKIYTITITIYVQGLSQKITIHAQGLSHTTTIYTQDYQNQ